ncbi:MAG: hypothetical protein M1834_000678 [Cirrosporium novae-zelandiae]|nr:MAG: hypothetical protein M1834_000678 [Cirrosporium novae-zelandiae]
MAAALLVVVCAIISTRVAGVAGKCQERWMRAIERRVNAIATMLGSTKAVKMLGLEQLTANMIQNLRIQELEQAKNYNRWTVYSATLSYATVTLYPVLVYASFTAITLRDNVTLDTTRMFASLTLISLLTTPLIQLFQVLPQITSAFRCLVRIQNHLNTSSNIDFLNDNGQKLDDGNNSDTSFLGDQEPGSIKLKDRTSSSCVQKDGNNMITVEKGDFGWSQGSPPVLRNISLTVNRGELIAIIGPVGCGKSILLKSLVREAVHLLKGSITTSDFAKFAYWDQTFLALARALYSRPTVLILDDVFSGLDRRTQVVIFENLWGPNNGYLLQHRVACVLATHAIHQLRCAYRVIALNQNKELEQDSSPEAFLDQKDVKLFMLSRDRADTNDHHVIQKSGLEASTTEGQDTPASSSRILKDRQIYSYYLRSMGIWNLCMFALGAICYGVFIKIPDQWLNWWTVANQQHPNQRIALASLFLWTWHMFRHVVVVSGSLIHHRLLEAVRKASYYFLSRVDIGVTTNRFSEDILLLDGELPLAVFNVAAGLTEGLVQITLVSAASAIVVSALPVIIVFLYLVQRFYLRTSKQLRLLNIEYKTSLVTQFLEMASGVHMIREDFFGVDCAVALVNITTLGEALMMLIVYWTSMESSMGAISRIKTFVDSTDSEEDKCDNALSLPPTKPTFLPAGWLSKGEIRLNDVCASYNGSTRVLDSVSLAIHHGQKVAICGKTGSGKSSLIRAASIHVNLDVYGERTDTELIGILRAVKLYNKVFEDMNGLDAEINLELLSMGERQLFCLSRAMAVHLPSKCGILIMDETTSSVNTETEKRMGELLKEYFPQTTVVVVMHRL